MIMIMYRHAHWVPPVVFNLAIAILLLSLKAWGWLGPTGRIGRLMARTGFVAPDDYQRRIAQVQSRHRN
jgi:hypothetical protein